MNTQQQQDLALYTIEDFKAGLVRIDFREHSHKDIVLLREICEALCPDIDPPAYTFGASYFFANRRWYHGAEHNLIGNNFQVVKVSQIKHTTRQEIIDKLEAENAALRAAEKTYLNKLSDILMYLQKSVINDEANLTNGNIENGTKDQIIVYIIEGKNARSRAATMIRDFILGAAPAQATAGEVK